MKTKSLERFDDDDRSRTRIATPNCIITKSIPLKYPSPEIEALRIPTTPPWPAADGQKGKGGALAIVDYAALSPEPERILREGEMASSGYVEVGMEFQTSQGVTIVSFNMVLDALY